jgi:hypothetical protein
MKERRKDVFIINIVYTYVLLLDCNWPCLAVVKYIKSVVFVSVFVVVAIIQLPV